MTDAPKKDQGQRAPTLDAILWLGKLGVALAMQGVCAGARVRVRGWEKSDKIALELKCPGGNGLATWEVIMVPVGAAIDHDTELVLRAVANSRGLTVSEREIIGGRILKETDLAHVRH